MSAYLSPGAYSAFVLQDNGTWEQPSVKIGEGWTEFRLENHLERLFGGFFVAGLQEDPDAPEEYVDDLGDFREGGVK